MLSRFGRYPFGYAAIRVVLSATAPDHGVPLTDVTIPPPLDVLAKDERLGQPYSVHDPRRVNPKARTWLGGLGLPGLVLLPFAVHFVVQGFGWAAVLSVLVFAASLGAAGGVLLRGLRTGHCRGLP